MDSWADLKWAAGEGKVGGLLFCFALPQSATNTVTQSANTAFAMKLERNE